MKWTNSLKETNYQNSFMKKYLSWIILYLLKKLNLYLKTFHYEWCHEKWEVKSFKNGPSTEATIKLWKTDRINFSNQVSNLKCVAASKLLKRLLNLKKALWHFCLPTYHSPLPSSAGPVRKRPVFLVQLAVPEQDHVDLVLTKLLCIFICLVISWSPEGCLCFAPLQLEWFLGLCSINILNGIYTCDHVGPEMLMGQAANNCKFSGRKKLKRKILGRIRVLKNHSV